MKSRVPQPLDFKHARAQYPGHQYTGRGQIVAIRQGSEIVGHLSRKGWDSLGWLPMPGLSTDANIVRTVVMEILADFAARKQPMVDAWAEVLNTATHDAPFLGSLAKLAR
jgi:hypothetical protein